ncbi:MAG: hypothetical protein BGO68_04975 [Candidatus Amoebophilus sp. 36-38]|nr:MAG: hypothetical protein BGO68_04975 [Candidatus Amoebophilus sp. 36-38]
MPATYTRLRIFIRLCIFLICCTSYQAVNGLTINYDSAKQSYKSYRQQEPWYYYPLAVQVNPHIGVVMPMELLDIATDKPSTRFLLALGGRTDISLLYPKKWIWEHFDCYPKLGVLIKYDYITANNIIEKGHIVGSIFYIEPNYNHLSGWEILPRFGIGIAYLNMPGAFSSIKPKKNEEGEEEETTMSAADVDPFRQGPSLNLIFDILVKYRITPKWHLNFSLGLDYLPELTTIKSDEDTDTPVKKKTIEIYTASLGCSYTFNPSDYHPERILNLNRRTRIDIAFFSSFRKPQPTPNSKDVDPNSSADSLDTSKYYYLGGLYAQWSFRIFNNQAIVLGTEWMKDFALKKEIERSVKKNNLQASFLVGHEFLWGKLIFGQYAGIYALNNGLPDLNSPFFNFMNLLYVRLGLNYRITDYLYVGVNLKTAIFPRNLEKKPVFYHYTGMEYLDFRIAYTF